MRSICKIEYANYVRIKIKKTVKNVMRKEMERLYGS
jgi:hypothetical protein